MCTTTNLHRDLRLPWPHRPLQAIHKRLHTYCPAIEWTPSQVGSQKSEWVLLSEDALKAFQALKWACMSSPVLAFADYMKDFLLKTDTSKEGLGVVLSQKQADGHYHLVAYDSQALTAHEKNYHSTKLEFLALKWAVMEHFKEYLLYQPFLVKTDNNPLMYIMTTHNLDVTGHQWVGALAKFNFQLEYQKGWDNTVATCWVELPLILAQRPCNPSWMDQPCSGWGWPGERKGGMSHCWASPGRNACRWLGCSQERGPWTRCSNALVRG